MSVSADEARLWRSQALQSEHATMGRHNALASTVIAQSREIAALRESLSAAHLTIARQASLINVAMERVYAGNRTTGAREAQQTPRGAHRSQELTTEDDR
jgi:hypothetical protein